MVETLSDAFGKKVKRGDTVVYAGKEDNGTITMSKGAVSDLEEASAGGGDRFLIERTGRSCRNGFDDRPRAVWVAAWKVSKAT
jgi:hypothetical protein